MKLTTRDLTIDSIIYSLMFVGAKVSIPFSAVPITFQLFFSVFAGLLLGCEKWINLTTLIYRHGTDRNSCFYLWWWISVYI